MYWSLIAQCGKEEYVRMMRAEEEKVRLQQENNARGALTEWTLRCERYRNKKELDVEKIPDTNDVLIDKSEANSVWFITATQLDEVVLPSIKVGRSTKYSLVDATLKRLMLDTLERSRIQTQGASFRLKEAPFLIVLCWIPRGRNGTCTPTLL